MKNSGMFAALLLALVTTQPTSAQTTTRAATADDLAIANAIMDPAQPVAKWGSGVKTVDRALVNCLGMTVTEGYDEYFDEEYPLVKFGNMCAFPIVFGGTSGYLDSTGACLTDAAVSEGRTEALGTRQWESASWNEPCFAEITKLSVGTGTQRPATIDAAIAVVRRVSQAGTMELANKSDSKAAKPWKMSRKVIGVTVSNNGCHTRFEAPQVLSGSGADGSAPAQYMNMHWRKERKSVRGLGIVVGISATWMTGDEYAHFILPTEADAAQLAAAFETLMLRC